jgi:hypothetical protein
MSARQVILLVIRSRRWRGHFQTVTKTLYPIHRTGHVQKLSRNSVAHTNEKTDLFLRAQPTTARSVIHKCKACVKRIQHEVSMALCS